MRRKKKKQIREGAFDWLSSLGDWMSERGQRLYNFVMYSVLSGANRAAVNALKNDPRVKKAIEDFEKADNQLKNTMEDIKENPEEYREMFRKLKRMRERGEIS